MSKPKVVILGAGFAGLTAAKNLQKSCDVTLVDKNNFQTFSPLLYQVATAGLAADHIAYPIRSALRKSKIKFRMGSPISIDHKNKSIKLDSSEIFDFDYLVVALGSVTNDFGIPGVSQHALGMKNVTEALHIRSTVLRHFEDLCRFQDEPNFEINVIGGGPTGVEMAGAIAELRKGPLSLDLESAADKIRINIIEAGPRILPSFDEKLSRKSKEALEKLGVQVQTLKSVKEIKSRSIAFNDGTKSHSDLTIWTAGVSGESSVKKLNIPYEKGRVPVESTLQVKNYPHIFAIGDIAGFTDTQNKLLPMVAPVAMQQGRFVAQQIEKLILKKTLGTFIYKDKGSMATIGRHKAVVQVKRIKFSGILAWYAWLWLHLIYLLGGRNKLGTMADWTWNYLTFDRSNRHIIDVKE